MLSLNPSVYFDEKIQKPVIRKILKKKVPRKILNRKKQGFTGPDKYYMNFEKYRKILQNSDLIKDNIINKEAVENYFQKKDHWRLWKIAVLELWYKKWISQ
jgi:asparagine synthase (glutamine-hydrolysing)